MIIENSEFKHSNGIAINQIWLIYARSDNFISFFFKLILKETYKLLFGFIKYKLNNKNL